jgi:peptide/nickel transport system permease protein
MALVLFGNALRDALEERGGHGTARAVRLPVAPAATATPVPAAVHPENALLSVQNLKVAYGTGPGEKEVVHGVSLHVAPGEVLGLVGESGSGKTQTAFSVLGLLPEGGRVSDGSILFDGKELTTLGRKERTALRGTDIAYIPQEPMSNLDPSFRIGYQLTVPMRTKLGLSKQEATRRALELLARVGIADPEKTFRSYPHEVSGGMAQRVLIAGAVSCNPRLLIADEPTTALDVTVQAEVLDLLRDLQLETGMAVVMVTHNFGVVADICDRVAVMQNGRLVEADTVEKILTTPSQDYTQRLLDSMLEDGPVRPYPFDDDASPVKVKD